MTSWRSLPVLLQRERDLLDVLYYWNGRRLQRLVAERELLLRIGGIMDQIGDPALDNRGRRLTSRDPQGFRCSSGGFVVDIRWCSFDERFPAIGADRIGR